MADTRKTRRATTRENTDPTIVRPMDDAAELERHRLLVEQLKQKVEEYETVNETQRVRIRALEEDLTNTRTRSGELRAAMDSAREEMASVSSDYQSRIFTLEMIREDSRRLLETKQDRIVELEAALNRCSEEITRLLAAQGPVPASVSVPVADERLDQFKGVLQQILERSSRGAIPGDLDHRARVLLGL